MKYQTNIQLGNLIAKYRIQANLTQEQVGQITGLTRQAISLWEKGQGIGLSGWVKFKRYLPQNLQEKFEEETRNILIK